MGPCVGQRSRRALVLLVALISPVFAFASAAGEARAEQLPQAPQQPAEGAGTEAAGPVAERPAAAAGQLVTANIRFGSLAGDWRGLVPPYLQLVT